MTVLDVFYGFEDKRIAMKKYSFFIEKWELSRSPPSKSEELNTGARWKCADQFNRKADVKRRNRSLHETKKTVRVSFLLLPCVALLLSYFAKDAQQWHKQDL